RLRSPASAAPGARGPARRRPFCHWAPLCLKGSSVFNWWGARLPPAPDHPANPPRLRPRLLPVLTFASKFARPEKEFRTWQQKLHAAQVNRLPRYSVRGSPDISLIHTLWKEEVVSLKRARSSVVMAAFA